MSSNPFLTKSSLEYELPPFSLITEDHYLEALRNRLAEYDVHVCTIKPGYIDTGMTRGMQGLFWLISADQADLRQKLADLATPAPKLKQHPGLAAE